MKIFSKLYDLTLGWAKHKYAERWLFGVSFAESSFFVIPPDVMLAPMVLASPDRAWRLAFLTTIASVLGGVLGYFIGLYAMDVVMPYVQEYGYEDKLAMVEAWFAEWGLWALLIAGFSPVPYKLFTIASGAMGVSLLPFILVSLVGRGARFFMVAAIVKIAGPKFEPALKRYADMLGWLLVLLVVIYAFI